MTRYKVRLNNPWKAARRARVGEAVEEAEVSRFEVSVPRNAAIAVGGALFTALVTALVMRSGSSAPEHSAAPPQPLAAQWAEGAAAGALTLRGSFGATAKGASTGAAAAAAGAAAPAQAAGPLATQAKAPRRPVVDWGHLRPEPFRFQQPVSPSAKEPGAIVLENGENMPLYPLAYLVGNQISPAATLPAGGAATGGQLVEWAVPQGDIISYVVQNEEDSFQLLGAATWPCTLTAEQRAAASPPLSDLMLDIGANHGIFGLMALSRGCQVEFYDPQRKCNDLLQKTVDKLDLGDRAKVIMRPVGVDENDEPYSFEAAYTEICAGQFQVAPGQHDEPWKAGKQGFGYAPFPGFKAAPQDLVREDSITLDDVIAGRRVAYLKIDVEGYEARVLRSGLESFRQGLIDVAVIETTEEEWRRRTGEFLDRTRMIAPLVEIFRAGYTPRKMSHRLALGVPGPWCSEADFEAFLRSEFGQIDLSFVRNDLMPNGKCNPQPIKPAT